MTNYTCTRQTKQAQYAIRAAKNVKNWGPYAATQYALKRGVNYRLLILAVSLEYNIL